MEYRQLGKTGLEVSATGLGAEHLAGQPGETIAAVLHTAVEAGIHYIDLLWDNPDWWSNVEPVFTQYRSRFIVAAHWGGDLNQVALCCNTSRAFCPACATVTPRSAWSR